MMQLIYVDPQSYHGLAKYDVAYLRGLMNAEFAGEISFFCSDLLDQQVPAGVTVCRVFHYNRVRWLPRKVLSYALSMLRIFAAGFRRTGSIFHFQWVKFPPVDLLVIVLLRKVTGARVVLTAHNVVPHGEDSGRHRMLGRVYRTVDRIVVHNADTAAEISRRFSVDPGKMCVLRHGLINLGSEGTPRHDVRLRRFIASRDICFVFFGRGSRYKGLDMLLDAWPRVVAATNVDAGLIVIGAVDPDLKAVANRAADDFPASLLLIDERVPEADLYLAATSSDVVILPHRKISQSGVLLSVLGLAIPVLVSPLAGLREPLDLATVGWSFDGTEEGLARQLGMLIDNPGVLANVKNDRSAWAAIEQAYDWNTIAAEGSALYEEMLADSTRG